MSNHVQIERILILDDDSDFRKLLLTYLGKLFEGVELEEYDPVARGVPGEEFDWSRYDALILDYYLSIHNVTGLDILAANRKNEFFPATIMLTGAGNEEVAVRAIKAGVYDYLRKENLDKDKLRQSILEAFEKHKSERRRLSELTHQSRAFNKALFYQQLEASPADEAAKRRVLLMIQLDDYQALEESLGVILRDNIVRHLARQSFEVFDIGECNPNITRLSDVSVALLIDSPESVKALEFNLKGLCEHLQKRPYRFGEQKHGFTVSMGAVILPQADRSAETLIRQAQQACETAAREPGNTYYLYAPGGPEKPAPATPRVEPEAAPGAAPAATEESETTVAAPEKEVARRPAADATAVESGTAPPSEKAPPETEEPVISTPGAEPVTQKPVAQPPPATKGAPAKPGEVRLDDDGLEKPALRIKRAFDNKRIVQTYQPVMPLFNIEGTVAREMYRVGLQMIDTNGDTVNEEEIYSGADTPAFRQFIDRWMLRESIGRVVNSAGRDYTFILRISDASLSDQGLFNWLRKLLAGLDESRPGHSIALEVAADDFSALRRKVTALVSYLGKAHGFRFVLGGVRETAQISSVFSSAKMNMVRVNHEQLSELQGIADGDKGNLLQALKSGGIRTIVDDVEDANGLTSVIGAGADYAMGIFIGEAMSQIDDNTNVESFEII